MHESKPLRCIQLEIQWITVVFEVARWAFAHYFYVAKESLGNGSGPPKTVPT